MTSSSLACFATYRPPVPLDIYSRPLPDPSNPAPPSPDDEILLSDGERYNQNCRDIPKPALQELVRFARKNPALAAKIGGATTEDVESGRVTGVVFVSEREGGLETLHVALRRHGADRDGKATVVLSLAEIYGADAFGGGCVRMEDSPCVAVGFTDGGGRAVGHSLVYVSTREPASTRRTPWTAVYRTRLSDGRTERLTPPGQYDLSPAVSPSGKKVAVANFQWNEWTGEIESLRTHIAVMNVDRAAAGGRLEREIVIRDGGWPSWGSDDVIFFHRGTEKTSANGKKKSIRWGVFRHDMATGETTRVTPDAAADFMTPAAVSEHRVAVAAARKKANVNYIYLVPRREEQCRHIEVFDSRKPPEQAPERVTAGVTTDHFNPSVLDGGRRVGYHRCRADQAPPEGRLDRLQTPAPYADVALLRMSHAFPAISKDGSKLAFVDNQFRTLFVWTKGSKEPHVVYRENEANGIFFPMWHPKEDTLCVCLGPSFSAKDRLDIVAFRRVSTAVAPEMVYLTKFQRGLNNAFPSFNEHGDKLVFRSTRDRTTGRAADRGHKNLYVMHNTRDGEDGGAVTQLTDGEWTDTHCSWAPRGVLIVFSSTRDKPGQGVPDSDNGLDPGYFAVYLASATDGAVVRVVRSGADIAGHVNHPVFSPDRRRIAFAADLAAVSADPISLPFFLHSVRPYGDIFAVEIDADDMGKNKDVEGFCRLTHSRYEYSMPAWTDASLEDLDKAMAMAMGGGALPPCPYARPDTNWDMTGHLYLSKRCC